MEVTYTEICTNWNTWDGNTAGYFLTSPPQYQVFVPSDSTVLSNLYIGQQVSSLTHLFPFISGIAPYKIGALIYIVIGLSDVYSSPAPGRTLIGFILLDNNNQIAQIIDDIDNVNSGSICFLVPSNLEEIEQIECFQKLVWNLQCKYATCVENYLTKLQYGIRKCSDLDYLKNFKRNLEILNCYDPSDIINDCTCNNNFSYNQIKQLISNF